MRLELEGLAAPLICITEITWGKFEIEVVYTKGIDHITRYIYLWYTLFQSSFGLSLCCALYNLVLSASSIFVVLVKLTKSSNVA